MIPFATVRMSGTTSQLSQVNQRPVRPNPAITSSRIREDAVPAGAGLADDCR